MAGRLHRLGRVTIAVFPWALASGIVTTTLPEPLSAQALPPLKVLVPAAPAPQPEPKTNITTYEPWELVPT